jgi:hypothetical protein
VWYVITNEPVKTEDQAWNIVFAYRRRWKIETCFRYGKCELGMESPRLWDFENRIKLLTHTYKAPQALMIHQRSSPAVSNSE